MTESPSSEVTLPSEGLSALWTYEDWMAIWVGALFLLIAALTVNTPPAPSKSAPEKVQPAEVANAAADPESAEAKAKAVEPVSAKPPQPVSKLQTWLKMPSKWTSNPLTSLQIQKGEKTTSLLPGMALTGLLLLVPFSLASCIMGNGFVRFIPGFIAIWLLAVISFVLSKQVVVNQYNLEYVLWGLAVGMIISNTVGTPNFLKPALCGEFYIKTGLVLLGAEILLGKLVALGIPGICISWIVTPIVLVTTFIFGQKILKMESPSLNIVISADMSVCGASAAIATGAACKAKKEEISCAVGLSLAFTAIMMVIQPFIIRAVQMDELVAGAWIGGTIDSTGAVAAAGKLVSTRAGEVAVVIKMIQNILIGVVAFAVAVYWTTRMENGSSTARPSLMEIWRRFPKFILGFVAASLVFSWIAASSSEGTALSKAIVDVTKEIRTWLFCFAFVCIGLETHFRTLAPYFVGGKPLVLYVCGQSLNLALSLFMSWLMFGVLFKDAVLP